MSEKLSIKKIIENSKSYCKELVTKPKNYLFFGLELLIAVALIFADLLTKKYIYGPIAEGGSDIILIEGVLRFTAVENTGASFGIFKDGTKALTIISLITVCVLFVAIFFTVTNRNPWLRASLVMIFAGGIGNIVDRLALHYVRDFIYFELIDFAVFNVADSCLTVGTIVLIIYIIFFYARGDKKNEKDVSPEETLEP